MKSFAHIAVVLSGALWVVSPSSALSQAPVAVAPLTAAQFIPICAKYQVSPQTCNLLNQWTSAPDPKGHFAPLKHPTEDLQTLAAALAPVVLVKTVENGITSQAYTQLQTALQEASTSASVTQVGGSATAPGSTNLVTKPTTSDFISIASESGAFTDTVNGSTATIQANALGLTKYLNGLPVFARWDTGGADALQPLNFTVTLNIAQSGSTVAPTAGTATSVTPASLASLFIPSNDATLSSFGANYVLYRRFNPQSDPARKAWEKAVTANLATLNTNTIAIKTALNAFLGAGFDSVTFETTTNPSLATDFTTWTTVAQAASATADATIAKTPADAVAAQEARLETIAAAYKKYLTAYSNALLATPAAVTNAQAFLKAIDSFQSEVYSVLDQARGEPLVTIGYTYTPSAQMPDTHNFTASGGFTFGKAAPTATPKKVSAFTLSGAQLTGNFTAALFGSRPSSATYGLLKDVQGSGEFDLPFGGTTAQPLGTFSLAGYAQYQYSATVLNITSANELPGTNIALPANSQAYLGTPGWLGVVQGKFVFNLKQGLSIPIAVKWSNKTDLLQANDVRGQFGISYDFSALSSLIKPPS